MLKHALIALAAVSIIGCGASSGAPWPSSNSDSAHPLTADGALVQAQGSALLLSSNNFIAGFALPTSNALPGFEAVGSDGDVWFTEKNAPNVGRVTSTGQIKQFHIPSGVPGMGIASGGQGLLWFGNGSKIGRVTTTGSITEFNLAAGTHEVVGVTKGPDGNMWFADKTGNAIGRITPTGMVKEFALPTHGAGPQGIAAGPDGNLWFTETTATPGKVGKITTAGVITEFSLPTRNSSPNAIIAGPDGNLYVGETTASNLAKVTTTGIVTEFVAPDPVQALAVGPDGEIWFTFTQSGHVSEFNTATHVFAAPITIPHGAFYMGLALVQGSDGDMWLGSTHNEIDVYEENIAPVGVRLIGEKSIMDPRYGFILGYFNGTTSTTSQVVSLTVGESVRFINVDSAAPHTVSFLGNATATHAPFPPSFNGSATQSPAGTAIGTVNFSSGPLNPGQMSLVYETGGPGFYMMGCAFHYNSNAMRTVIIVQ